MVAHAQETTVPSSPPPTVSTSSSTTTSSASTPERILQLSTDLARCIAASGSEIDQINLQTRLLSFNAQIEAARACIVAPDGFILADSAGHALKEKLDLPDRPQLFALAKGYRRLELGGRPTLVGFARSPGFETYATGWNSVVLQTLA